MNLGIPVKILIVRWPLPKISHQNLINTSWSWSSKANTFKCEIFVAHHFFVPFGQTHFGDEDDFGQKYQSQPNMWSMLGWIFGDPDKAYFKMEHSFPGPWSWPVYNGCCCGITLTNPLVGTLENWKLRKVHSCWISGLIPAISQHCWNGHVINIAPNRCFLGFPTTWGCSRSQIYTSPHKNSLPYPKIGPRRFMLELTQKSELELGENCKLQFI